MQKSLKKMALKKLIVSYLSQKGFKFIQPSSESLNTQIIEYILASEDERLIDILPFFMLSLSLDPKSDDYFHVKKYKPGFIKKLYEIWSFLEIKTPLINLICLHYNKRDLNNMLSEKEKQKYKDLYSLYKRKESKLILVKEHNKQELLFQFNLSVLFARKQKDIIQKIFKNERLTKTEKEYFSRTIKKKLNAIADKNVYNLARTVLAVKRL